MEIEFEQFEAIFGKYKNIEDRHESLYIFVINGLVIEELVEKVKKILSIVDSCNNPVKKSYLKSRLNNFIENLAVVDAETIVNCIYMVSNSVSYHELRPYWKETLTNFKCDKFIVKYDNNYQLGWLKNLLLDRSYINALHLNNNVLKHIHLGFTKKRLFKEKDEKKMDINMYINENIKPNEIVIIYGVSSFLKNVQTTQKIKLLTGHKRDDELLEEYDKILNDENAVQLQWWLDRMNDPKEGKKIVFGKDIGNGITDGMIKTVFCSPERSIKLVKNYSNDNIEDKIVVIRSYGDDIGARLVNEFNGAIGIKFY